MMIGGPRFPEVSGPRPDKNGEALQRAIAALNDRRPEDAERIAGEILKSEPRHSKALQVFASAILLQGRTEDAIATLEAGARGRQDPEIDTQLGIALRQAGRNEEALSRLKRATKRQPPFAPAFYELGSLLVAVARHDEAIETLNRGRAIAPMMPELSIQLGYIFLERRDCAQAKMAFMHALGISPESPAALFGMAKAHQEIGENDAAAAYFRRYLRSNPTDTGGWLHLGHVLLELGDLDAGYECFRTAARGDPKRYGDALGSLVKSARGRFWLKPSDAARFFRT